MMETKQWSTVFGSAWCYLTNFGAKSHLWVNCWWCQWIPWASFWEPCDIMWDYWLTKLFVHSHWGVLVENMTNLLGDRIKPYPWYPLIVGLNMSLRSLLWLFCVRNIAARLVINVIIAIITTDFTSDSSCEVLLTVVNLMICHLLLMVMRYMMDSKQMRGFLLPSFTSLLISHYNGGIPGVTTEI